MNIYEVQPGKSRVIGYFSFLPKQVIRAIVSIDKGYYVARSTAKKNCTKNYTYGYWLKQTKSLKLFSCVGCVSFYPSAIVLLSRCDAREFDQEES